MDMLSPFFRIVIKMTHDSRIELYKKIEERRQRPLIVYATSIRSGTAASIAGDVIVEFINHVDLIPNEIEEIDLLIISNGGDPIAAWRIMSILRERFKKVSVLIPFVAYSAATLLALGADEIVMHPYSNLGPVDPQIIVQKSTSDGSNHLHVSSEDIRNFTEFVKSDFGVTEQRYVVQALDNLSKEVGVLPIGAAKRSNQLSISLGEKMLSMHMKDESKIHSIAKALNSSYFHHGYAVSRKEAKEIGLNIADSDEEIESLIGKIWRDISAEMKYEKEFDFTLELLEMKEFEYLLLPPTPNLKAHPKAVDIKVNNAILETVQACSCLDETYKIFAWRNPNEVNININVISYFSEWQFQLK